MDRRVVIASVLASAAATGVVCAAFAGTAPFDLDVYMAFSAPVLDGNDLLYAPVAGRELPFTYPPFAALVFAPLTLLPAWAQTALLTFVSMLALCRLAALTLAEARRPDMTAFLVVVAGTLALEPTQQTIVYGQVNLLLAWLVAEDMLGRGRWRGLGIGLAMGFKLTPGIFLLALLVTRQWRPAAVAAAAGALTGILGMLALPGSSWDFWTRAMWDANRAGGLAYSSNQSVNGGLWRLLGDGGSRPVWAVVSVLVLALAAWLLTRLSADRDRLGVLIVAALAGLLVSPVSWSHHWVWIAPLVVWLIARGHYVLAGAWAFASVTWMIWWMPHTQGREVLQPWWGKLITDAYLLAALVTLLVFVTSLVRGKLRAWPARMDA